MAASRLPRIFYAASLQEVATELGITRERVRQIECKALKKVRAALLQRGYRLCDLIEVKDEALAARSASGASTTTRERQNEPAP